MPSLRLPLAVLHLFALAIGIAAVYGRARALHRLRDRAGIDAVLHADNWYGIAALLWVATGLWRAFGGVEKGTDHYLANHWFMGKLGLFALVLLLELWPMAMLIGWRLLLRKGTVPALHQAPALARLTYLQLPLLLLMVALAAALARGY